jgi:hypothetical protein
MPPLFKGGIVVSRDAQISALCKATKTTRDRARLTTPTGKPEDKFTEKWPSG